MTEMLGSSAGRGNGWPGAVPHGAAAPDFGPLLPVPGLRHLNGPPRDADAELGTRGVIDLDGRTQVPDLRAQPWCRICHLVMRDGQHNSFNATAWLAGPSTLFTAAHNLLHASEGYSAVQVWVRDNAAVPAGFIQAAGWDVHPQWRQTEQAGVDIGVVWLPQPLGQRLGWLGCMAQPEPVLRQRRVRLSGYPGDKPSSTQWFQDGPIDGVGAQLVSYRIDTGRGQSGSPVFYGDAQQQPVAVAVHAYDDATQNLGVRITPALVQTLLAWKR